MKTRKIMKHPHATHHPPNKETSYISVNFLKITGNTGGKIKSQDTDSTRLQELSPSNITYFGAIHYDIHFRHEIRLHN